MPVSNRPDTSVLVKIDPQRTQWPDGSDVVNVAADQSHVGIEQEQRRQISVEQLSIDNRDALRHRGRIGVGTQQARADFANCVAGISAQGWSPSNRIVCGEVPSVMPRTGTPDVFNRSAIRSTVVDLPDPMIPSTITSLDQMLQKGITVTPYLLSNFPLASERTQLVPNSCRASRSRETWLCSRLLGVTIIGGRREPIFATM